MSRLLDRLQGEIDALDAQSLRAAARSQRPPARPSRR
jgi:hypothetical protein